MSITCTGYAGSIGGSYTTIASQSLGFDASLYAFCKVSGSYGFHGGSGNTTTISLQQEVLSYNAPGPEHAATAQSWWSSRLLYNASTFFIQLIYTTGSNTGKGYVDSSSLTAVFYN